jgi:hypothetical protein
MAGAMIKEFSLERRWKHVGFESGSSGDMS